MTPAAQPTRTLYTRFRDTARRFPDATAIETGPDSLTYAQLLDLTERLAGTLTQAAGGPPRAVGLLASRSLAVYAGYLATLRAGATVVPLNPAFPPARNRQMCRAAAVDVVVVDDAGLAQAGDVLAGVNAVAVHLTGEWRAGRPVDRNLPADRDMPAYQGRPDDIAYTLFTSGSTGSPKGVPIRHRHLDAYLDYCVQRYAVGPDSRLSQTFDLTFDPSVFDMFVAWTGGATLVVAQPDEILTPVRFVTGHRITHWFCVPSVVSLARRLRTLAPASMPALRWSLFAGEQLTLEQARAWADAAPNSTVENLYGPTELAITCTGFRLPAEGDRWPRTRNGTVPIGTPYPHLQAVVLTDAGTEGDDGELCVRGPQRFDGYLDPSHDPGRFVRYEDGRASAVDGTPAIGDWYRTGDRVCRDGGVLVHLGRIDDQVKLHGYRIELGEIESVVREHPGVDDVVVLALDTGGAVSLHALYTGEAGLQGALAGLVGGRLPAYMMPQRFRHVTAFPTNANGKVDRRVLSQLASTGGEPR